LLQPFSLKLWLKLGLVAGLAEAGAQLIFPPIGNHAPATSSSSGIGAAAGRVTPHLIAVFVVLGVLALLIGLALFYLASRMQLVLMDIVATRTTLVAPVWNRTSPKTWRWIGLKLAAFLIILLMMGLFFVIPAIFLFHSIRPENTQSPSGAFFGGFALLFVMIFLSVFVILFFIWALRDFVLPYLLFEDTSASDAIRNAIALVRREPGSVSFYLFMKLVLSVAAGIAAEICIMIFLLILGIPTGAIGFGLWFALHGAGSFGTAIMYISFALLGLVALILFLGAIICVLCAVLVFYQAYTLYFLGGRIPIIGNLLQPPPPHTEPPPLGPPLTGAPAL
jgi:hypothetical protein